MDIWKQLFTAGFAHFLNLVLSVYLQNMTHEGNGCQWYLITLLCDTTLGVFFAYVFFKIVDETAIKFDIEVGSVIENFLNNVSNSLITLQVLKSGVYTDKDVPVDPEDD